jgi:hypothetical protein
MNQKNSSTQQQIFKPNPPTPEMVERAKFVDKTFVWKQNADLRSGDKRPSK